MSHLLFFDLFEILLNWTNRKMHRIENERRRSSLRPFCWIISWPHRILTFYLMLNLRSRQQLMRCRRFSRCCLWNIHCRSWRGNNRRWTHVQNIISPLVWNLRWLSERIRSRVRDLQLICVSRVGKLDHYLMPSSSKVNRCVKKLRPWAITFENFDIVNFHSRRIALTKHHKNFISAFCSNEKVARHSHNKCFVSFNSENSRLFFWFFKSSFRYSLLNVGFWKFFKIGEVSAVDFVAFPVFKLDRKALSACNVPVQEVVN